MKSILRQCSLFMVLSFYVIGTSAQESMPAFVRDSLDNYVQRALKEWQIPGVAIAVVKDGKEVVAKAYGVRETGKPEKVDLNTLFYIGSNSKAFTATAVAMLAEEKKVGLDEPVVKVWPDFKLYDPWVTKEVTPRDLLSHRIGFETFQGDFMFYNSDMNAQQIIDKWAKVKPVYSFRSKWGYTNAAFLAAGEVVHKVSGMTWDQFVTARIFKPLQMNRTFALSQALTDGNRSSAHTVVRGKLQKIPFGKIDGLGPAGSISSSITDMSHWVMAQLDTGRYQGQRVIDANAILATRSVSSILGDGGSRFNRGHFYLYGLGWFLEEYEGRKIVSHTGGVNGFLTSVCLIPEERLGIIVLTNNDDNGFFEALRDEIRDAYLNLPYRNYSKVSADRRDKYWSRESKLWQAQRDSISRKPKTDLPLSAYAGTYVHDVAGKMTIAIDKGKLIARFEHLKDLTALVEPMGGSRFLVSFSEPIYGDNNIWPFKISDGKITSVTVGVNGFVEYTNYDYIKQ